MSAQEEVQNITTQLPGGPQDLPDLQRELLKIGTRQAFECQPRRLLTGLKEARLGRHGGAGETWPSRWVSAKGQDEIPGLGEGAHVPVILVTQVLETLAKKGHPCGAEISDASMSAQPQCVMFDKGLG
jgi:pyruvate kinase